MVEIHGPNNTHDITTDNNDIRTQTMSSTLVVPITDLGNSLFALSTTGQHIVTTSTPLFKPSA